MSKDVQQSNNKPEPELLFNGENSCENVPIDVTKKKLSGAAENPVKTENLIRHRCLIKADVCRNPDYRREWLEFSVYNLNVVRFLRVIYFCAACEVLNNDSDG
jgi:hypothetical protein